MINLRTAPAYARVAVGVTLSAALSGIPTVLILATPISAAPRSAESATAGTYTAASQEDPPSSTTTSSTTSMTTTTNTTTTTTTTSAPSVRLSGKTSQRRPISFRLTFATVENLRYRVVDRCPSGRHLFIHSWGFPPLQITSSQFGGKFVAKPPAAATTTIKGKIAGKHVTGSLSDRTRRTHTRRFCTGKATFDLSIPSAKHKPAPQPGPGRHPR
jgi:hypothetical protein